jgi:hypothetical protein
MGTLSIIFLVLAGVPALLPHRRVALAAAGVYLALMVAAFFLAQAELGLMRKGEGPAFWGTIFYFGLAQTLLAGSLFARTFSFSVARRVAVSTRSRIVASSLLACCAICILAVVGYFMGFASTGLLVFAGALASPLGWFACSFLLLPDSSFKPMQQSRTV